MTKVTFDVKGEYITDLARDWYWYEGRSYDKVRDLLAGSMMSDSVTAVVQDECIRKVLFYQAKLAGSTRDETYHYEDTPDDIPEDIKVFVEANSFKTPFTFAKQTKERYYQDIVRTERELDSYIDDEDESDEEFDEITESLSHLESLIQSEPERDYMMATVSDYDRVLKHPFDETYLLINKENMTNPKWVNDRNDATVFKAGASGLLQLNNIKFLLSRLKHPMFSMALLIDIDIENIDFILSPKGEIRYVTYMSHDEHIKSIGEPFSDQWVTGHRSQFANNAPGISLKEKEMFDDYFMRRPDKLNQEQKNTLSLEYALGKISKSIMQKLDLIEED